MASAGLRIGEVAGRSGVSLYTLRYYERRRLLPRAPRTQGGFRLFPPETIGRVRFIKQAQELGFSLDEIGELLSVGGEEECRRVRDLLRVKITELDDRLKAMRQFRRTLARHLDACERELKQQGAAACCPVVVGIKGGELPKK